MNRRQWNKGELTERQKGLIKEAKILADQLEL